MTRFTIAQISANTRITRKLVEEAVNNDDQLVTYEAVGAAIGCHKNDVRVKRALREAVDWAAKQFEGVLFICEPTKGYRRAKPQEAADILSANRRQSVRKIKRTVGRTVNLTKNVTLPEADQARLYVELSVAGALMEVGSARGVKRIEAANQSRELPPASVLDLFRS